MSPVIRLPSWREVLEGPWALRLRSGATGAWLMRGEAEEVPELDCRFVAGVAARTTEEALAELGSVFQLEEPPAGWDDVARAVPAGPIALLRKHGFEVEALHEPRPGESAENPNYYDFVDVEWAQKWPAEEIWVARKA